MLMLALGSDWALLPVVGAGPVLQGLGQGPCLPSLNATVAGAVPIAHLGIATAAHRLTNQVGTAFGITILTMSATGTNGGMGGAFLIGATLSALSVSAAAFIRPQGS